jgi:CII-binding regulator of phage lambda lysogenization HflD
VTQFVDVTQQMNLMALQRNFEKYRDRLKQIKQKISAYVSVEKAHFSPEEERRYINLFKLQVTGIRKNERK